MSPYSMHMLRSTPPSKIVGVNIDTPYIKGLAYNDDGVGKVAEPRKGETAFVERCVRTTYEDAYTREFREWWECVVNGKEVKVSVQDARGDREIFKMIMQARYGRGGKGRRGDRESWEFVLRFEQYIFTV